MKAARYELAEEQGNGGGARKRGGARWKRIPLDGGQGSVVRVDRSTSPEAQPVLGGLAAVATRWRSSANGTAIVTVALVNTQQAGDKRRPPDPAKVLFQCGLRCEAESGSFLPYSPMGAAHPEGSEEREVEFLYRGVHQFARGHGAAAEWDDEDADKCRWVSVDFVPSVDVPRASFEIATKDVDPRYCSLEFLVTAKRDEVVNALRSLVEAYEDWVKEKRAAARRGKEPAIAGRLVERAEHWLSRLHAGLEMLKVDDLAWRCFRLANEAMLTQMVLVKARPKVPHARVEGRSMPTIVAAGKEWRPFQIAFLVASIESLCNVSSRDRDVADVVWFPTGGGKTEAYLLVCAFEMVRRRLVHGDRDTATAIISRYTLRFLTAQQFQRTAALVAALEVLRRRLGAELGDRPFTLGLWVGDKVTPNRFQVAHDQLVAQLGSNRPRNPYLLQACPCCGTAIFPRVASNDRGDFGVVATVNEFRFFCPSEACPFHESLPLDVVDESMYRSPPSMLLGTVDKFALLPWDTRSRVFFGGPGDDSPPPSLILQDELHLISGPLGSLAAPYDAAIDTIIKLRGGHAKRICSTATIRNAREQVRGLYGRDAAVFPPPCGAWDDAFFFRTDHSRPGRTYVGVMGQGYVKPVVAMAWASAALAQSVNEVKLDAASFDAYWTVLAYHNSRRELGRTLSAARDEIQARIQAIASAGDRVRELGEPMELSAQMVKSLGEAIEALEKPYSKSDPPPSFVPCTSIISVGVDLDRLGIMLVNGQPKLTSEYIQATSRVGRGDVPGLVVSLYSATKPRDRSHYEDFGAFHRAIYRYVEPTSVTPYAIPARERTLHAALVSVIRHATRFSRNEDARTTDLGDPVVVKAVEELLRIMAASDPTEAAATTELMKKRLDEWAAVSQAGSPLLFERRQAGMAFRALLTEYGKSQGGAYWRTMTSVRNVDAEVGLGLL